MQPPSAVDFRYFRYDGIAAGQRPVGRSGRVSVAGCRGVSAAKDVHAGAVSGNRGHGPGQWDTMGGVEQPGKHAGKRRAEPAPKPAKTPEAPQAAKAPKAPRDPTAGRSPLQLLLLAGGVTLSIVAWGYLVYAAIDFGATARDGKPGAWWFLGLASLGAVACLFVGLLLVSRLLRMLGIIGGSSATEPPASPRPAGGKRIAR
jgi:hypothetical protein